MSGKTGGPAFPAQFFDERATGITMRDYFAAKAMLGLSASSDEAGTIVQHGYKWIAEEAYKIADAMLQERTK